MKLPGTGTAGVGACAQEGCEQRDGVPGARGDAQMLGERAPPEGSAQEVSEQAEWGQKSRRGGGFQEHVKSCRKAEWP